VPPPVYAAWDARAQGAALETAWQERFAEYGRRHPDLAGDFIRRMEGRLPERWDAAAAALLSGMTGEALTVATRRASQIVLERLGPLLPELFGGSADLTGSNLTAWPGSRRVSATGTGNYLHYGVREFAMSAIANGMTLHGGFIPYCGTFLTFSDYGRNALRMAALMGIGPIFIFSHDSIGLGEDGPTHQPIEHAASLRLIPNMDVWRPCDTVETAVAWTAAIERRQGPTSLLLSRQNLPYQHRGAATLAAIRCGGYILAEPSATPLAVIIATGSEVAPAAAAQRLLQEQGCPVRLVSMPATTVFDRQDPAYRAAVIPPKLPAVAVEAGVGDLWRKYVGRSGAVIGLDRFGESAPAAELFQHFGFTADRIAETVTALFAGGI
jgi:transketolase